MSKYKNIIDNLSRFDIDLQYITDRGVYENIPNGDILYDIGKARPNWNTLVIQDAIDKSNLSDDLEEKFSVKGIFNLNSISDRIIELKRSPKRDEGDRLDWVNVKFSLKPEINVVTGIPSMGKSAWLDNVIMNSVRMHGYKWAIFSPENLPLEEHARTLIEIATKSNFYGRYGTQATTEDQIKQVVEALNDYLFFIDPVHDSQLKIENILELVKVQIIENGVNAFVLDPYNEFSHTRPTSISETEYVSHFMQKVRRFVKQYNVACWLVAHPTKLKKGDDGKYPVPSAYDIAGSANFYNKSDNIISVHREKNREQNPDNIVQIWVQKIRKKGTGELGCYELKYDYPTGTYAAVHKYNEGDMP